MWTAGAVAAVVALSEAPPITKPVALFILLPTTAILAATCWSLAVGLWRGSVVAHLLAIVSTSMVALVLALAIVSDAFHYILFPEMFDPGRLLTEATMLLVGPGVILALLLLPTSLRTLAARYRGSAGPASAPPGGVTPGS
jgi:hypothetical protein